MKKVSDCLKKYQTDNHFTYKKTAESLHMSKSTIYAYIHNLRNPTMKSIKKLAVSLNMNPIYLIDDFDNNALEEEFLKELRKNTYLYQNLMENPITSIKRIEKILKKDNELKSERI